MIQVVTVLSVITLVKVAKSQSKIVLLVLKIEKKHLIASVLLDIMMMKN